MNGKPSQQFFKGDEENLTFLNREANSLEPPIYREENHELYGPMWIFVTLVVEFVILGHMSAQLATKSESAEMLQMLSAKNTSASLHRIMRLAFTLAFFYLGLPFSSYLMFKSTNAMEVTFFSQLNLYSYSFAI